MSGKTVADLRQEYDEHKAKCEELRKQIKSLANAGDGDSLQKAINGSDSQAPARPNFESRQLLRGHFGKIYAMQWQRGEGHNLVSASQDGNLMIWNGHNANKKQLITLRSSWVMTCAYSPSGDTVACGGLDNICSIYSTNQSTAFENSHAIHELAQHEGYLSCCRYVSDDEIITSSGDSTCIVWDINERKAVRTIVDHSGDVMSVSINFDNPKLFVSGSCDTTARIFDIRADKSLVGTFRGHNADINAVQWFPDFKAFGTGSDDSYLRLFDQRAYRQLNSYTDDTAICGITSLCFSKSGKYLFAGYDDNPFCLVWNTTRAQVVQRLTGIGNLSTRVSCIGMQGDGKAFCTGSWDNLLRVWA